MPPCNTRDDPAEVAAPKSPRSTSATARPRSAASCAMQAPVMPPPMTTMSKRPLRSRLRFRCIRVHAGGQNLSVGLEEALDLDRPRELLGAPPQCCAGAGAASAVAEQNDELGCEHLAVADRRIQPIAVEDIAIDG